VGSPFDPETTEFAVVARKLLKSDKDGPLDESARRKLKN
jgi:hypothetical protein